MKHETHAEYDAVASGLAERALLSAWAGLGSWHEELVLVGGLVPRYLCRPPEVAQALPRPVTLDADLGISLGASMGQYGSLQMDLQAQGFRPDPDGKARFVRRIGDYTVPLDFLTESPPATSGVAMVDGIPASITPGIDRALGSARTICIEGVDLQGARQSCNVRVCAVGPFLALKHEPSRTARHRKTHSMFSIRCYTTTVEFWRPSLLSLRKRALEIQHARRQQHVSRSTSLTNVPRRRSGPRILSSENPFHLNRMTHDCAASKFSSRSSTRARCCCLRSAHERDAPN